MFQKILSIIVPTYNMEKYLSYCMDSFFIHKNLSKLEVLIVNDGSTDRSLDIAKEYASRAGDVFKIIDKGNGNYGSCINAALPVATAKYVKVVDADDSVNTENLDDFVSFLSENDVDLALSDFVLVDENRIETKKISYDFGKSLIPMEQICATERFKDMEMHAVTYRRELLLKSGYVQTEGISYTDQQWIFAPMSTIKTVGIFNRPVYKYLVGRAGQTVDPVVKIRKMADRTKCVLDMAVQYEKLFKKVTPVVKSYLDARIRPNIQDIYLTYFSNTSKIDKTMIEEFDKRFKEIAPSLYNYIGLLNLHIRLWRRIAGCTILETVFCKCFTVMLWIKLSF